MSQLYDLATQAKQISATTTLGGTRGIIKGIFVSTTTAGTIKVWDSKSASGTVLVNTITPAAATWYSFGDISYSTGLTIQISNTIQCTVSYASFDNV